MLNKRGGKSNTCRYGPVLGLAGIADSAMTTDPASVDDIIGMAWCDKTSFDAIEAATGVTESAVIAIMRKHLKPSSFRLWRKRVSGRTAKHGKKMRENDG
jgi:uncharacterized protein (TIGR03643 family)